MKKIDIVKQHIEQEHNQAPATSAFVAILKKLHAREFVSPKQFYEVGGEFYKHTVEFIGNLGRALYLLDVKSDGLEAVNKNMEKIAMKKGKEELLAFAEELVTAIHNETTTGEKVASIGELPPAPTAANIKEYIDMLNRHELEIKNLLNR